MYNLTVNRYLHYEDAPDWSEYEFVESQSFENLDDIFDGLKRWYEFSDEECSSLFSNELMDRGEYTFLLTES